MTDITPAEWASRHHTGLLARDRARAGHAPEADRHRRSADVPSIISLPGLRPAQGHAREQVLDPGLRRAEGDRRPEGQVRRAQRRRPAGRDGRARTASGSTRPSGKAAIDAALGQAAKAESATDVSGPFADDNQRFSKTDPRHRLRRGAVLEGRVPARPREDREARGHDEGALRQGGHHGRVHRRRRAGAAGAGRERVHRLRRGAARAADRVPRRWSPRACRSCSR